MDYYPKIPAFVGWREKVIWRNTWEKRCLINNKKITIISIGKIKEEFFLKMQFENIEKDSKFLY